ncbi:MAG: thioredoxin domain-containing protein [Sulfurimonas sp.]|nr:thioredoxin domain-containing protein [Sulfurimonas sp.]
MLKLLAITLLLSSSAEASNVDKKIESFLKKTYSKNGNIESINVKVADGIPIKGQRNWLAYVVGLDAILKKDKRKVVQKMVWFSDGNLITKEIFDLNSGININDIVTFDFKDEYYKKENLIYGNENAKHKVVIFSDPLCPFCRAFVPKAINEMRKEPNKFAIYYYHLPLSSLHPAAVELVKAAIALELKGKKDVVLNLYKVKVNPNEKSVEKILEAFNKVMNSKIRMYDLLTKEVTKQIKHDLQVADALMVQGTPTMFFDGKRDKTKNKYKEAK